MRDYIWLYVPVYIGALFVLGGFVLAVRPMALRLAMT